MNSDGSRNPDYGQYVVRMKLRTKSFALRVIRLCRKLPKEFVSRVIGGQLLRAGTSVGSNYRAACRARTAREFTAKIRIVMEEADESHFWLELIAEAEILPTALLTPLTAEAAELVAIFTSAHAKATQRSRKRSAD